MTERPDSQLQTGDFDYDLPPRLIAQTPLEDRAGSRLLVLERNTGSITHSVFRDLPNWLDPGDLLIANNSKVYQGRIQTRKAGTGGNVELLLLKQQQSGAWQALAKPARRLKPGDELVASSRLSDEPSTLTLRIIERAEGGLVVIQPEEQVDLANAVVGATPLPPYISENLEDADRYQTVYAKDLGSAAAPTAGLHFDKTLINALRARGIDWTEITLHVGLDTFRPVTSERIDEHRMHSEWYSVPELAAQQIRRTQEASHRVVAIGTTAARTLESAGQRWHGQVPGPVDGRTSLFITPGYDWSVVDAMVTNFHLPKSTLLMMVSAFATRTMILDAYREAIAEEYRFYSFGDAMLIL